MAWGFLAPRLADAYVTVGDFEQAHKTLLEIQRSAGRSAANFFLGSSGRRLGELALAHGDPEEAVRHLEVAIEILQASGCENELGLPLGGSPERIRLKGNDAEAIAVAQEAVAMLDRLGTLEEPDRLRHELAAERV